MALADRVYELFQHPTYELRIGGVLIQSWATLDGTPCRVYSLRGGETYDEETRLATPPWLEIEVSRIPFAMRAGMPVTLDAGYYNEHVRLFTGGVWALGEEDRDYLRTQCIGTGATAADGSRIEATASLIGGPPIWPPIPSGQYIDFGLDNHLAHTQAKMDEMVVREAGRRLRIPRRPNDSKERQTIYCKGDLYGAMRDFKIPARDVSGQTVKVAVEGILDDAGIGSHNISIGSFTLAAEGATLDRMPGAGMLTPLLQLQGAAVRQLPSGLVIGRVLDEQPAPTAAFNYSNTDQQYARIIRVDPPMLVVPFNPLAQIWQTHALELDYLGVDGRYWVASHEWEITEGGALSYLDLRGGDEFGGTIGINPVASFVYSVALQAIGTELFYVITIIPTSSDSDGSIDTSQRTWTTNQTTIPPLSDFDGVDGPATVRIAAADIVGDFEVTLHEEDNDGLADDFPGILDLSASSSAVTVPPFFVAAGTKRYATPDGAQTKNTTTPSSKTATAVGARLADGLNSGHAVYGHDNGSLDLTLDANVTIAAALAAVSPSTSFTDVKWDWRDHSLVWALTDDCRLYVSINYGVSFFLLHNLRTVTYGGFGGTTPGALGNDIGLPGGGGVYIHGGDGAGRPLIAYNVNPLGGAGNVWIRVTHLGDLLTDLATPADATMRIVAVSAPGYRGDTYILSWASGGVGTLVAIYHTNDPPGPARSLTRATGLTAGLKNGRVMMESGELSPRSRIAQFGDRDTWVSDDGIAYAKTIGALNLPSGYTPNHGFFVSSTLGGMPQIYEHMLAVENAAGDGGVMKSTDEGDSWNFILGPSTMAGWDTGAKAKKIASGAPLATTPTGDVRVALVKDSGGATTRDVSYLQGQAWTTVALPAQIDNTRPRIYCPTPDNWIVVDTTGFPHEGNDVSKATRTVTSGASWVDAAIGDENTSGTDPLRGLMHIARGADGLLWGIREAGNDSGDPIRCEIYSSPDGGTWTLDDTLSVGGSNRYPKRLAAHPTDPNVVALLVTTDSNTVITHVRGAGGVWTTNTSATSFPPGSDGDALIGTGFAILPNGRMILIVTDAVFGTNNTLCYTSDNRGASWQLRQTITNTDHFCILAGFDASQIVLFRVKLSTNTGSFAWVSTDQGLSYAPIGSEVPSYDGSSDDSAKYDPLTGTLIAFAGTAASGAGRVWALSPVSGLGIWRDITYNLPSGSAPWDALAVIPR